MRRGRRILLVPVALLAALVALWPGWRGHSEPKRATRPPAEQAVVRVRPGDTPCGSTTAASSAGAEALESHARVHGVVTGATGVLWGARVVVYEAGSDTKVAEAWTNPEGAYSLAVDPQVAFDLSAEPSAETGLLASRRENLALRADEDRTEDFALGPAAEIRGRAVDAMGNGRAGVDVLALRPEDAAGMDGETHPNALVDIAVARVKSAQGGTFRLRGLLPGTYVLGIRDPRWTLAAPTTARTGDPEFPVVVVPALSVDLRVLDVETEEPVPAFSVRVVMGGALWGLGEGRELLRGEGKSGRFSRRVPWSQGLTTPSLFSLEVAATGFAPSDPLGGTSGRQELTVWLRPLRDPNTTIRISFDDGRPYLGPLSVVFKAKSGGGAGRIRLERVEDGLYRSAMPHGRWSVTVWPEALLGEKGLECDAEVTERGGADLRLVLPAGGTVVITPPSDPGSLGFLEGLSYAMIREAEADPQATGTCVPVPPEGARVEGVAAGLYQVGYRKATKRGDAIVAMETVWFRDIRVAVGSTEEITLPAE